MSDRLKQSSGSPVPPKARVQFRRSPSAPAENAKRPAQHGHVEQKKAAHGREEGEGILGAVTPQRLIRILVRKWMTIGLAVAFGAALAFFYLWRTPKIYRAASLIEMTSRRPRIMQEPGAVIEDPGYTPAKELFNTRLRKFKGQALREIAFRRFTSLFPANGRSEEVLRGMMGTVSFNLLGESRIVQISAERTDPELCAAVVNAYADATEEFTLEENRREAKAAVAWLEEQAETQKASLEQAEQAILDFRRKTQIDVLENKQKSIEEAVVELRKSLVDIETKHVLAEQMVENLKNLEVTPESVSKLPDTVPRHEEIQQAVTDWNTAISDKTALLSRYTEKHPKVIAANEQITARKEAVIAAVRGAVETAQSNHKLLQQQMDSLKKKMEEQSGLATDIERRLVEGRSQLTSLERQKDAFERSHKVLLKRIDEARLSVEENTTTVKVVERSRVPASPVSPVAKRIWLLAVFFGFAGGLVLALITDTLEDRISGTYDVEHGLGLKILGLIPHVSRKNRKDIALSIGDEKQVNVAEAYAGVRSILEIRRMSKSCGNTLMVSSTAPEEGKTVSACNIAISFARTGKKTVLIDFDLRRPRVGRIFGMTANDVGLIDVLAAKDASKFEELPLDTEVENLSVIGSMPSRSISPAEVMDGEFLRQFFNWVQRRYELVVIDTPPVGVVAEALLLAKFAHCAVVVCRPDVSRKRASRYAVRQLMDTGADVVGAVVNDVNFSRNPYFSNYDHHYNYSHYGYYYSSKSEED